MLETGTSSPFSPLAFQASLQTSNIQVRNRTTGVAVGLIKRSHEKNHLSSRDHTQPHLCPLESQPDATGFSNAEPDAIEANPLSFAEDFVAEHSRSGTPLAQDSPLIRSIGKQARAASKSVQP